MHHKGLLGKLTQRMVPAHKCNFSPTRIPLPLHLPSLKPKKIVSVLPQHIPLHNDMHIFIHGHTPVVYVSQSRCQQYDYFEAVAATFSIALHTSEFRGSRRTIAMDSRDSVLVSF